MSFAVFLTAHAENDLERVADGYVDRHPQGEERFLRDFEAFLELIARFPLAGRSRAAYSSDIRSWNVHPFVVFYTVDDRKKHVLVRAIVHGSMDLDDLVLE